jgi:hypothetical protein
MVKACAIVPNQGLVTHWWVHYKMEPKVRIVSKFSTCNLDAPILVVHLTPIMKIQSGQNYRLVNVQSGSSLDYNQVDHSTAIGFTYHGGENQRVCMSLRLPMSHRIY